ncbi:MAG: ABC transporter [Rhodocyclaceae bacterium]
MSVPAWLEAWQLFMPGILLGMLLAATLGALGISLKVRNEAVAALAHAQVAVLGAMLAMLASLPPLVGAWTFALCIGLGMASTLRPPAAEGTGRHLLLLLGAWAASMLIADNHTSARLLSASAIEGQLLLIRWQDWPWHAGLALSGMVLVLISGRAWLTHEWLPWLPGPGPARLRRTLLLREAGVITILAAGALALGVFVTLAMVLVPASLAWSRAHNLTQALLMSALLALLAHLVAISITLLLDQTYPAVLTLTLATFALAAGVLRKPPVRG